MNKLILVTCLLCSAISFANQSRENEFSEVKTCFQGVHFQNNWMAIGTSYKDILIQNSDLSFSKKLNFDLPVQDFYLYKNSLFVLINNKIEIFNLEEKTFEIPIFINTQIPNYAKSLFLIDDKIYISLMREGAQIFSLASREKVASIQAKGHVDNIYIHNSTGYIYASNAGIIGGQILSAVYLFDPSTNKITHKTLISGAPGNGIFVDNKNVFLGKQFFWQVRKKKVHKKKFISRYKSVFIPRPYAKGRAYRDNKNLYYCDQVDHKPHIKLRSSIER
ncbi:MAG: hypothetical protein HOJ35_08670 [Bdellovibrionales bacterium]|jgi:hypothetical protein|nr:hypothetical protein [Bdellovibrionales bacterium]